MGMTIEQIKEVTNLSVEEIKELGANAPENGEER